MYTKGKHEEVSLWLDLINFKSHFIRVSCHCDCTTQYIRLHTLIIVNLRRTPWGCIEDDMGESVWCYEVHNNWEGVQRKCRHKITVTRATQNEALLWKVAVLWKSPLLVPEHFDPCPYWYFTFLHAGNIFRSLEQELLCAVTG